MTDSDIRAWAEEPELLPCPFCGSAVRFRAALWPSDGCTDAVIHAGPSRCGMDAFDVGTADRSVIAAWNNRAAQEEERTP